MPVYREGEQIYRVRIYRDGLPKSWKVRGSKRDAEKFEARKMLELEAAAGTGEYRTAPRFSELCAGAYRVNAELRLAPATWTRRQYHLATLMEFFGDLAIDRIHGVDIERYQNQRRKAGIAAATINGEVKKFLTVLRYAQKQGIPCQLPHVEHLVKRATTGRVLVWATEEVEMLYRALQIQAPHLLAMTAVMLNTGLRPGEALALEWRCVDLDRGLLLIHPNEEWRPKNGKPREVPIGAAALPYLTGPRASERWVFARQRRCRGAWQRYSVWPKNQWNKARRAAGVGGSPHVCRHTFASHFLAEQPDLYLLGQVLGHSHTRMTEIYSHLLPDYLERARDAVHLPAPLTLVSGDGSGTVSAGRRGK